MKNLKVWHVLGGIGLLGIFLSDLTQYINNANGSSLYGPSFFVGISSLLMSMIFIPACVISFVLYLIVAIINKKVEIKQELIKFCIFVLIGSVLYYLATIAPAYH